MARRRYFKQLRIAQFRAIIELADKKGFAAAAASLDLSTPSVWQQIRSLEDEFNVPLLRVSGQKVSLTSHGKLLVDLATPVVEGFDSLVEQFSNRAEKIPKRLSVASPANILVNELPSPIHEYHKKHKNVELSLIDLPSNPARRLLEDGEVDLAVVGQLTTSFPERIVADPVTTFPFMVVCAPQHPIMKIQRIGPASLAKFPLVVTSSGTNSRKRVDEVFEKAGLLEKLRIVCEANTKDLLLQYVQLGFGITIAPISPRYAARSNSPYGNVGKLVFRDVSHLFGHEHIVILRRRHRHEPTHQMEFRQTVLGSIKSFRNA